MEDRQGDVDVDDSTRSALDPFSLTRIFSYQRLSNPSSSSSVDCGTPRGTGPPTGEVVDAAVVPDSRGCASAAVTPPLHGRAELSSAASGMRTAEPMTPDRPSRRKNNRSDAAIQLPNVESDQTDDVFHESTVCI